MRYKQSLYEGPVTSLPLTLRLYEGVRRIKPYSRDSAIQDSQDFEGFNGTAMVSCSHQRINYAYIHVSIGYLSRASCGHLEEAPPNKEQKEESGTGDRTILFRVSDGC